MGVKNVETLRSSWVPWATFTPHFFEITPFPRNNVGFANCKTCFVSVLPGRTLSPVTRPPPLGLNLAECTGTGKRICSSTLLKENTTGQCAQHENQDQKYQFPSAAAIHSCNVSSENLVVHQDDSPYVMNFVILTT